MRGGWWVFVTTQIRLRLVRLALGTVLHEITEVVTILPATTICMYNVQCTMYNVQYGL